VKKKNVPYKHPSIEVVLLDSSDIITTSSDTPLDDKGNVSDDMWA